MPYSYSNKPFRYLTEDEFKQVIGQVPAKHKTMFWTIFQYGLRRGEVGLIKKSDITREGIWITRVKRRCKNGTPFRHLLPLNPKLRFRLLQLPEGEYRSCHYLFHGRAGKGLSGEAVAKIWREACCKTILFRGQTVPSVHCLRHSTAMRFAELGLPPEECQFWLGHANLNSTMVYYAIPASRAKSIGEKITLKM